MKNPAAVLEVQRPGVLSHWCPGCHTTHSFNVHDVNRDGRIIGWDGDIVRPNIAVALRFESNGTVCEYTLKGGVQLFLQSCTHALVGSQRHLLPILDVPVMARTSP